MTSASLKHQKQLKMVNEIDDTKLTRTPSFCCRQFFKRKKKAVVFFFMVIFQLFEIFVVTSIPANGLNQFYSRSSMSRWVLGIWYRGHLCFILLSDIFCWVSNSWCLQALELAGCDVCGAQAFGLARCNICGKSCLLRNLRAQSRFRAVIQFWTFIAKFSLQFENPVFSWIHIGFH